MAKIAQMTNDAREGIEYAKANDIDVVYLDEYMCTTKLIMR